MRYRLLGRHLADSSSIHLTAPLETTRDISTTSKSRRSLKESSMQGKRASQLAWYGQHDGWMFFEYVLPAASKLPSAHTRLFLSLVIFFGQALCIAGNLHAQQNCANIDGVWQVKE